MDRLDLPADRLVMLRLLEAVRRECRASSRRRSWSARVGLAGNMSLEVTDVQLDELPAVVLLAEDDRKAVYTTLRDVVFVALSGRDAPALPTDLAGLAWPDEESARVDAGELAAE